MKKIIYAIAIVLFLFVITDGIQAQNSSASLDQIKLMQQYVGSWQANIGKDTSEVWDTQQYGKAFIISVSQVIKGKKTPLYLNNICFDPKDSNFKGFVVWTDGSYSTWIGSFVNEKKFNGEMVQNFNPGTAYVKLENVFDNAKAWTWSQYNADGLKILEYKFIKVK